MALFLSIILIKKRWLKNFFASLEYCEDQTQNTADGKNQKQWISHRTHLKATHQDQKGWHQYRIKDEEEAPAVKRLEKSNPLVKKIPLIIITAPTKLFFVGYFRNRIKIMGTIKIALAAKTLHIEEGRRSIPNLSNQILAVKIRLKTPDFRIVVFLISRIFFQKMIVNKMAAIPKFIVK